MRKFGCVHWRISFHSIVFKHPQGSYGGNFKLWLQNMVGEHIGPYSRKRNNYSSGISLTTKTWFIFLLFCNLILPAQNGESRWEKYWKLKSFPLHYYFPHYSVVKTTRKINQVCAIRLIPAKSVGFIIILSRIQAIVFWYNPVTGAVIIT